MLKYLFFSPSFLPLLKMFTVFSAILFSYGSHGYYYYYYYFFFLLLYIYFLFFCDFFHYYYFVRSWVVSFIISFFFSFFLPLLCSLFLVCYVIIIFFSLFFIPFVKTRRWLDLSISDVTHGLPGVRCLPYIHERKKKIKLMKNSIKLKIH